MSAECLIVLPTVDEGPNLETLLPALLASPLDCDVLVVDDDSRDGTAERIEELRARTGRVALLRRPRRLGLGTAYVAGFRWALEQSRARFVFQMDADWSHDPRFLPALLERARKDADVAIGSRYREGGRTVGWDARRLALSRFGTGYARAVTSLPLADATSGFKCIRREVLEALDLSALRSNGYAFQIELCYRAWQAGFRLVEVPIVFAERRAGSSKLSLAIALEAAWRCVRLRAGG